MNPVAEEIRAAVLDSENDLTHYGTPRHSGRYPYGSGDDPYQHAKDFLSRVEKMRHDGFTYVDEKTGKKYSGDTAIAKSLGMSTTDFRTEIAVVKNERRMHEVNRVKQLRDDKAMGWTDIAREMGLPNESSARSLYDKDAEDRMNKAREAADFIKKQVDTRGMIDVGAQANRELNISEERMKQALYLLEREGYPVYGGRVEQQTNSGNFTTLKVICPPGTPHSEIYNYDKINSLKEYITRDGGDTFEKKFNYPESLDSKRLQIRYKDDAGPDGVTGIEKDGIIELRRGVPDLSLGDSRYSQVRIMVDGSHYLKGMAVYSDKLPDGVDVVFNTNKGKDVPMNKVLKEVKKIKGPNGEDIPDPDNPFGSLIKDADKGGQYFYDSKTGNKWDPANPVGEKKLGLINKRADEGDWTDWQDALPSQFLSKQSKTLAKKQLDLATADKNDEFADIMSLQNPTVKKYYLQKFSDECDAAAVHLKAAALPGQKYHVIIPVNSLKDTEVYAPGYEPGTKLALVRYPHGGTFEIPILTVNNKNKTGKEIIGTTSIDAIGINSKIAEQLSGADFDGDTVMCIPTHDAGGKVKIKNRPPLKDLEGFDPKTAYPEREGMRYMKNPVTGKDATQLEMGKISNLIADMTLAGATEGEVARAVKHSMVVIDAAKHKLDYKRSETDNGIAALHNKYQGHYDEKGRWHSGGAGTIVSRASGEATVDKRQGTPKINVKYNKRGELNDWYDPSRPEGALIYKTADDLVYQERYKKDDKSGHKKGDLKFNKDGTPKMAKRTQASSRMAETDDAYTLVSDNRHAMELVYAEYANNMKALANKARVELYNTGKVAYNSNAKSVYKNEVKSLEDKLRTAELNAPRERLAQLKAKAEVESKKAAARDSGEKLSNADVKKIQQRATAKYREQVGAVSRKKRSINISDREWEAIQAGAISENQLWRILNNTDVDNLRERAMPRSTTEISSAKVSRIKSMASSNYTLEQIADKLGVSKTTVSKYLKGGK